MPSCHELDCRQPLGIECHCPGCHETFTGIKAFDAHQKNGTCLYPGDMRKSNGEPVFETVRNGIWREYRPDLPGKISALFKKRDS